MIKSLINQFTIAVLIFIPVLSFILWILYIRKKWSYVSHLVLICYQASFVFISSLVMFLIGFYIKHNVLLGIMSIFIFLNTLICFKRYYGQGWFKTLIKYFIVAIVLLLFAFGLIVPLTLGLTAMEY